MTTRKPPKARTPKATSGHNDRTIPIPPIAGSVDLKPSATSVETSDDDDDGESPLDDLAKLGRAVDNGTFNMTGELGSASDMHQPRRDKGKAPVRKMDIVADDSDVEMVAEEDDVEEYDFSSELGNTEEECDKFDEEFDTENDVIVLSDDENGEHDKDTNDGDERPWKDFTKKTRFEWERMYSSVHHQPIGGSWDKTEDYQLQKDEEMIMYLQDFPLKEWVIPQQDAQEAYSRLIQRSRWRALGIRVYGRDCIPGQTLYPVTHTSTTNMGPPTNTLNQCHTLPPLPQQQITNRPTPGGPPGIPPSVTQSMIPPPHTTKVPQPQPMAPSIPAYLTGVSAMTPKNTAQTITNMPSPLQSPAQIQQLVVGVRGPVRRSKQMRGSPPGQHASQESPNTPPYPARQRPTDPKPVSKSSKKRLAEAEEFPWTRQIDFAQANANAVWDETIYDPKTLEEMAATRARNAPKVEEVDVGMQSQQRVARAAREKAALGNNGTDLDDLSTSEVITDQTKKRRGRTKGETGDAYHSGSLAFATPDDENKAMALNTYTPDEIVNAVESGRMNEELCGQIKIRWNPGKKGMTQELEQAIFKVQDTLATRRQLASTPILTRRAGECVIDFCPNLLWRSMLLRITSEAGLGNKDVRDRICRNGCYVDKATITKRISAALGQKQQTKSTKGCQSGDDNNWYNTSVHEFNRYVDYFGKRTSHRNTPKFQRTKGVKRKLSAGVRGVSGGAVGEAAAAQKREKLSDGDDVVMSETTTSTAATNTPTAHSPHGEADEQSGEEATGADDGDESDGGGERGGSHDPSEAISAQNSNNLDRMSD